MGILKLIVRLAEKQQYANAAELTEEYEKNCDILSVTDRSIGNKDRLLTLNDHNISALIGRCSPYTLIFKGKSYS